MALIRTGEDVQIPAEEQAARRSGDRGLGPMLRQRREDAGVEVREAAKRSRIADAFLARIELGDARPGLTLLRDIASAIGSSFVELFDVWDRVNPSDRTTVAEARAMVSESLATGVACPCCGRPCKEQRRSLSRPMVEFLRWLVSEYRGTPVDPRPWCSRTVQRGGDYAKIVHWGLAERHDGREPRWTPTAKGRRWILGQIKIHKVAVLWRNEVLRFDGEMIGPDEIAPEARPERGEARRLPGL